MWLSFNQPLTTICEKIKTIASLVSEISPELLPYMTHVSKFNKFAKKALNYFRIHQNSQKHKDYNSALINHLHIITVTTRTLFSQLQLLSFFTSNRPEMMIIIIIIINRKCVRK